MSNESKEKRNKLPSTDQELPEEIHKEYHELLDEHKQFKEELQKKDDALSSNVQEPQNKTNEKKESDKLEDKASQPQQALVKPKDIWRRRALAIVEKREEYTSKRKLENYIHNKDYKGALALLEMKENCELVNEKFIVNKNNKIHPTLLVIFMIKGDVSAVEKLLKLGAKSYELESMPRNKSIKVMAENDSLSILLSELEKNPGLIKTDADKKKYGDIVSALFENNKEYLERTQDTQHSVSNIARLDSLGLRKSENLNKIIGPIIEGKIKGEANEKEYATELKEIRFLMSKYNVHPIEPPRNKEESIRYKKYFALKKIIDTIYDGGSTQDIKGAIKEAQQDKDVTKGVHSRVEGLLNKLEDKVNDVINKNQPAAKTNRMEI